MRGTCQAADRKCIHTSVLMVGRGTAHRPMNALGGLWVGGGSLADAVLDSSAH